MKLKWDNLGEHFFKVGTDHGVLYKLRDYGYETGVAWNGLSGVDDSTGGRETTPLYTNGHRRRLAKSPPEYGGTIKCYTYPPEFEACLGAEYVGISGEVLDRKGYLAYGQDEAPFGFCYRELLGNDVDGTSYGYIYHVIYGAELTSTTVNSVTLSDSSNPDEMSFAFTSIPEDFTGHKPVSHLAFRSDGLYDAQIERLEETLYGSDDSDPYLPLPDEFIQILEVTVIKGHVAWADADDHDGYRPEHLKVYLYANGVPVDFFVASAEDDWVFDFGVRFTHENGAEQRYTVGAESDKSDMVSESGSVLITEDEAFSIVTEEYWPTTGYAEMVSGYVITETRS